jgi:hypothetical protein
VFWVVAHVSVWLTALLVLVLGERDWPWVWPTPAVPLFVVVGSMMGVLPGPKVHSAIVAPVDGSQTRMDFCLCPPQTKKGMGGVALPDWDSTFGVFCSIVFPVFSELRTGNRARFERTFAVSSYERLNQRPEWRENGAHQRP